MLGAANGAATPASEAEVVQKKAQAVCARMKYAAILLVVLILVAVVVAGIASGFFGWAKNLFTVEGPKMVQWTHDNPGFTSLLMVAIALLDTVPLVGHFSAKPLQYALVWIFGYPAGAAMIFICLYTSLTLQFVFGRYILHDCVRNQIGDMNLFVAVDRALVRERGLLLARLRVGRAPNRSRRSAGCGRGSSPAYESKQVALLPAACGSPGVACALCRAGCDTNGARGQPAGRTYTAPAAPTAGLHAARQRVASRGSNFLHPLADAHLRPQLLHRLARRVRQERADATLHRLLDRERSQGGSRGRC